MEKSERVGDGEGKEGGREIIIGVGETVTNTPLPSSNLNTAEVPRDKQGRVQGEGWGAGRAVLPIRQGEWGTGCKAGMGIWGTSGMFLFSPFNLGLRRAGTWGELGGGGAARYRKSP